MDEIAVFLKPEEAEAFKIFMQFRREWDKLFWEGFTGSLTIHKEAGNDELVFEWRSREKRMLAC